MSECEDDYYCEECYELFQNEELMECEKCKAKSKEDDLYEYDGRKLCEECYEEIMDEKADAIPFMELLKYVNQLPDEVMRYALQKILKAEWNREEQETNEQSEQDKWLWHLIEQEDSERETFEMLMNEKENESEEENEES